MTRTTHPGVTVLKFGGSSFRTVTAYRTLARHLRARLARDGGRLVVVVSAMPGETERLRSRLHRVDPHPVEDTLAGLLTLADTVSAHLLTTALRTAGVTATVLAGHQTGFRTDARFAGARLEELDRAPLEHAIGEHDVVVIPGGQATDPAGRPTWFGKNSSDLSAVAAAAALGVGRVEIHSDVAGIYDADPNLVPAARLLPQVSYDMASTLSRYGAKVLHRGALELACAHGIEVVCRINRPPFGVGTVIATFGDDVAHAVVLNLNSVVLRFAGAHEADRAYRVFAGEGIDTLRSDREPVVVVVGGYVDVKRLCARHGLDADRTTAIPVAEVRGRRTQLHLAASGAAAVELARSLHDTATIMEGRTE